MIYGCKHIMELVESHRIHTVTVKEDGKERTGVPVLHQLYRDGDYLTTRERDQWVEIKYCPICGTICDAELAKKMREREQDEKVVTTRKVQNTKTWCPSCDMEIIPQAVPLARSRRRFMYLCPNCGGRVIKGRKRRSVDNVAGVIQAPERTRRHNH